MGIATNTFEGGLNKDKNDFLLNQDEYANAQNYVLEAIDEQSFLLTNELGTVLLDGTSLLGKKILGHCVIDREIIIFSTNGTISEIGVFEWSSAGGIYLPYIITGGSNSATVSKYNTHSSTQSGVGLATDYLGFSDEKFIDATGRIFINGSRVVYFTDDNQIPRRINLDDLATIGAAASQQDFDDLTSLFISNNNIPMITNTQVQDGGSLLSGIYQFAVRYKTQSLNSTDIVFITNPTPVVEESEGADYKAYDGAIPGTQTSKSITITIEDIATNYDFIDIIVIYYEGLSSTFKAGLVATLQTQSTITFSFSDLSQIQETILIEDITKIQASYTKAKNVEQKDGILLVSNLETDSINLDLYFQRIANSIQIFFGVKQETYTEGISIDSATSLTDTYNGSVKSGYKIPSQTTELLTYRRGEVYSYAFVPILKGGRIGNAYHIPALRVTDFVDGAWRDWNQQAIATDAGVTDGNFNSKLFYRIGSRLGTYYSDVTYPADKGYPESGGLGKRQRFHTIPYVNILDQTVADEVVQLIGLGIQITNTNPSDDPNPLSLATGLNLFNSSTIQDNIEGWFLVRQERDTGQNRTIICQGVGKNPSFVNREASPSVNSQQNRIKDPAFFVDKYIWNNCFGYADPAESDYIPDYRGTNAPSGGWTYNTRKTIEFYSPDYIHNVTTKYGYGSSLRYVGYHLLNMPLDPWLISTATYSGGILGLDPNQNQGDYCLFAVKYADATTDGSGVFTNGAVYLNMRNLVLEPGKQDQAISDDSVSNFTAEEGVVNPIITESKLLSYSNIIQSIGDFGNVGTVHTDQDTILYNLNNEVFKYLFISSFLPDDGGRSNSATTGYLNFQQTAPGQDFTTFQIINAKYFREEVYNVLNDNNRCYGSVSDAKYILVPYTELGTPNKAISYFDKTVTSKLFSSGSGFYSGDTFICKYAMNSRKEIANSGTGADFHLIYPKTLYYAWYETDGNYNYRHYTTFNADEVGTLPYYPKQRVIFTGTSATFGVLDYAVNLGHSTGYNKQYNKSNNVKQYFPVPLLFEPNNDFSGRTIYSEQALEGEQFDAYQSFLINNYYDITKNKGEIWDTFVFNNKFYIHTTQTLFDPLFNQTAQIATSTGEVALGTSKLFSRPPIELTTTDGGFAGTQSLYGGTNTPFGRIWIDTIQKKIFKLTDSIDEITYGISKELYNYIDAKAILNYSINDPSTIPFDSPLGAIKIDYDYRFKRVIVTLTANGDADFKTYSYSLLTNKWISTHTHNVHHFLQIGARLLVVNEAGLLHEFYNLPAGAIAPYGKYFGSAAQASFIEYVVSKGTEINKSTGKPYQIGAEDTKVFDNMIIKTIRKSASNAYIETANTSYLTFDSIFAQNSYQKTATITLVVDNSNTAFESITSGLVKYKNNQFKLVFPRQSLTLNNTATSDLPRFRDEFAKVRLTYNNTVDTVKFVILSIQTLFRVNPR